MFLLHHSTCLLSPLVIYCGLSSYRPVHCHSNSHRIPFSYNLQMLNDASVCPSESFKFCNSFKGTTLTEGGILITNLCLNCLCINWKLSLKNLLALLIRAET